MYMLYVYGLWLLLVSLPNIIFAPTQATVSRGTEVFVTDATWHCTASGDALPFTDKQLQEWTTAG